MIKLLKYDAYSFNCLYIVGFFTLIPMVHADSDFEFFLLVKSTVKYQKSEEKKRQFFFSLSLIFQFSAELALFLEYIFFYLYATTPEIFNIPYY